jgi:hypothetical protein
MHGMSTAAAHRMVLPPHSSACSTRGKCCLCILRSHAQRPACRRQCGTRCASTQATKLLITGVEPGSWQPLAKQPVHSPCAPFCSTSAKPFQASHPAAPNPLKLISTAQPPKPTRQSERSGSCTTKQPSIHQAQRPPRSCLLANTHRVPIATQDAADASIQAAAAGQGSSRWAG